MKTLIFTVLMLFSIAGFAHNHHQNYYHGGYNTSRVGFAIGVGYPGYYGYSNYDYPRYRDYSYYHYDNPRNYDRYYNDYNNYYDYDYDY